MTKRNPQTEDSFEVARFNNLYNVSLGLSVAGVVLMPLLTIVRELIMTQGPVGQNLWIHGAEVLLLAIYPLALTLQVPRKILPAILFGSFMVVEVLILISVSHLGGGFNDFIYEFIYIFVYVPVVAIPFRFRTAFLGTLLLVLTPTAAVLGWFPEFPLPRFFFMVLPPALVMVYIDYLLTKTLRQNYAYKNEILSLALRDPLTGLYNRRHFVHAATDHLRHARRTGEPVCLLMLDLDHFKKVNDTWGHGVGDQVIVMAARALESGLRDSDLVARIGGEEFVACILDSDVKNTRGVADRIRQVIETTPLEAPGTQEPIRVTASIGIAGFTDDGPPDLEALLHRVDQALYAAKNRGRNRVETLE